MTVSMQFKINSVNTAPNCPRGHANTDPG